MTTAAPSVRRSPGFFCAAVVAISVLSPFPLTASDPPWRSLTGPFALNVTAVHPSGGGALLFAGMSNGEIAVSTDAGTSWQYRTPAYRGFRVHAFVQDPDHPAGILAATERGIFRSRDSARTWEEIVLLPGQPQSPPVLCFAVDPWKPATRFVGTDGRGLLRSTDGGVTWAANMVLPDTILSSATVWSIIVDPGRPDRILAAAGTLGLIMSTSGGESWETFSRGSTKMGAQSTHLLIHPKDGNTMLMGTDAGSIFRTTNGGQVWSPVHPGAAGNRIRSLFADPPSPGTVYAGTEAGIMISRDFGERWQRLPGSFPQLAATCLPAGKDRLIAFGNAIGLQTSTDGGTTWSHTDRNLGGATASVLALDPGRNRVLAAVTGALIMHIPDSGGWTPVGEGLRGGTLTSLSIDPRQPDLLYATSATGTFRSTDGGHLWQEFARSIPSVPHVLVQHPWFPTRMLASTDRGLHYSTDRGMTWREARPNGKLPPVHAFTFRTTNAGNVFATAAAGAVLLSTDGGISWETTRYGLGTDTLRFLSLDSSDPLTCYAWAVNGMCYRSLNGGLEWSRYAPPWEPTDRVLFAIDPQAPSSFVVLVNERTLYITRDGGSTWMRPLDRPVPGVPVVLTWNAARGVLLAGLRDRGVILLDLGRRIEDTDED